jgi:hypothetical protein
MSTQEVLNHHLQAFAAGNVEEICKDYDDRSVVIGMQRTVIGQAAIKDMMANFLGRLFRPGSYQLKMGRVEVRGELAYITWSADTLSHKIPLGTSTLIIKDGKIAIQTLAVAMNPNATRPVGREMN